MSKKKIPKKKSCADARRAVQLIKGILWPRDNPDAEWDAETIEDVASVIQKWRPREGRVRRR